MLAGVLEFQAIMYITIYNYQHGIIYFLTGVSAHRGVS